MKKRTRIIVGLTLVSFSMIVSQLNYYYQTITSGNDDVNWDKVQTERVERMRKWCKHLGNPKGKQGIRNLPIKKILLKIFTNTVEIPLNSSSDNISSRLMWPLLERNLNFF